MSLCNFKIYRPNSDFPNGGKMSQYLDDMEIGSKIDVAGPVGRIVYKRNGIIIKDKKKTKVLK